MDRVQETGRGVHDWAEPDDDPGEALHGHRCSRSSAHSRRRPSHFTGWGRWATASTTCEARARDEALARELKFGVTDMNGWQTAYGYDDGRSRPRFVRSAAELRRNLERAATTLHAAARAPAARQLQSGFDRFMALDARGLPRAPGGRRPADEGDPPRARARALRGDGGDRRTPGAPTRRSCAEAANRAFDDARDEARRRMIAVALGAGSGDRPAAVHGERRRTHGARGGAPRRATTAARRTGGRRGVVTRDVLLTLSLMLERGTGGALPGQPAADSRDPAAGPLRRPARPLDARRRSTCRSTRSARS